MFIGGEAGQPRPAAERRERRVARAVLGGQPLSHTTCLTQAFFKSGEEYSKL